MLPGPGASVEEATTADATVCPSGEQGVPTGGDAATVALFGLLGAALTGVRFLVPRAAGSAVPITATRSFQALLKAAIGMLAAILGLLFLRAGVVPRFTRVDSRSQILVYAVVLARRKNSSPGSSTNDPTPCSWRSLRPSQSWPPARTAPNPSSDPERCPASPPDRGHLRALARAGRRGRHRA